METNQPPAAAQLPPPPATREERAQLLAACEQSGDFAPAMEAAAENRDWNLHSTLQHAADRREAMRLSVEAANAAGAVARVEAEAAMAKSPMDQAEMRPRIEAARRQAAQAAQAAADARARAAVEPLITSRSANEDLSDASKFRALVAVEIGPFRRYAPLDSAHVTRGIERTLVSLHTQGLDPEADVILESERGWRYRVNYNADGQRELRLLLPNGRTTKVIQPESDGRGPVVAEGGAIHEDAEQFYANAPLPMIDLRDEDDVHDDRANRMAGFPIQPRDPVKMLRKVVGVRIARRK